MIRLHLLAVSRQDAAAPAAMQTRYPPRLRIPKGAAVVLLAVAKHPCRPMELSKKVKTALDETRMLILGAQILLGFELRAAFSEGFDKLPVHARHLEASALLLMVISVALMITPGTYHRIVEGGRDSGAFHKVTSVIADLSLLPFALALGIDVFVSIEHIFGSPTALAVGIGATLIALALWYGMPRAVAPRTGQKERAMT